MNNIEHREQMAAVGKDFKQWADEYFAEDSGNLDIELKAEDLLNAFNTETRYGWSPKKFSQHLKSYCEMTAYIYTLNPASVTGKNTDGERWQKRDSSGAMKTYYYVESVQHYQSEMKSKQAEQQNLLF